MRILSVQYEKRTIGEKKMDNFKKCFKTAKQAAFQFYSNRKQYIPELEHKEVLAESYLAMMEAIETWEPDRGCALESWVGRIVHQTLRKRFHRDPVLVDIEDIELLSNENMFSKRQDPERLLLEKEKHIERMRGLSQTARKVLKIINECECLPEKKNEAKRMIKKELREKEIAWNKIRSSLQELRRVTAQI